jgi:hypothetical protein
MARVRTFAESEKARLLELGGATLYPPFRKGVMKYYKDNSIAWWGGADAPTESPISSQVSCINHLESARLEQKVALQFARKHVPDAAEVLPIEGGFLSYEWVGLASYLNERGWSPKSRGKNITSVDAIMAVKRPDGRIVVLIIEWKYTERYTAKCLARSDKGTDRIDVYRSLLDDPSCPIRFGDHLRLFYDPYYQLTRQTLLAWQMIKHRELGATDWIHLHVAPTANVELLQNVTSPQLAEFRTMESAWKSVLVDPEKYRLVSPSELLPASGLDTETDRWLAWMSERYSVAP